MNDSQTNEKKTSRGGRAIRVLKITVITVIILAALLFLASLLLPKLFNMDRVVRFFRYMGLKNKAEYGTVSFDASSSNGYAAFGDGLLVSGEGGMILYDMEGEQEAFLQASLPSPVLCSGSEVSICFSPGNSYLAALDNDGSVLIDETLNGEIIDADVSEDGYISYLLTQTGYKSVATVLNKNQDAMFRFSSRTRYLNACTVSEGGKWLAVAALGEENSVYRSSVILLRTNKEVHDLDEESGSAVRVDLGNQILYDLRFVDKDHLCAIGQDSVTFLDVDGTILTTLSLSGQDLLDYDFSEDGFCAFLLEQKVAGQNHMLLVLDEEGKEQGKLETKENIRDISVRDEYVALLTDRELQILDQHLKLYYHTSDVKDATNVRVRDDGTALLINYSNAYLYIP